MADLFRFRCFRCQKLLGAPASRFGKTIQCPRCGTDLVVPTPDSAAAAVVADEPEPAEDTNAIDLNIEDLGVNLAPLPGRRPAGPSSSLRDPRFTAPDVPNPVAYLENPPEPEPEPTAPEADEPEPESEPESTAPTPPGAVPVNLAPRISPVTGKRPMPAGGEPLLTRRRDVVLPRTVVLAWSLGALLGTGSAFVAGLLIGHFVW